MVGAGFKPAQIATTLAGGVPRLAAPTEPGFRQNDTLCTSLPSSPPNQCHPRAAIVIPDAATVITRPTNVIPAHAGIQKGGQTGGAANRASFQRNPAERSSTRAQANICHYPPIPAQPTSSPRSHRHPRARGEPEGWTNGTGHQTPIQKVNRDPPTIQQIQRPSPGFRRLPIHARLLRFCYNLAAM